MGWNDHVDFQPSERLQQIIDGASLQEGTPSYGIARQVIEMGFGSLIVKQRPVHDTVIAPAPRRLARGG